MKEINDAKFESIINTYKKLLFSLAYKYLRDTNICKDIIQEVFIKLYNTHKHFEDDSHMKNWLIRVTINLSLDALRKNKRIIINNDYINNLPEKRDSLVQTELIYDCICRLKDNYKVVVLLFYYENYSVKAISNVLNISETNVSSRLERARKQLKTILIERREKNEQ